MTLNNIETDLPSLFQVMSSFSTVYACSFEDIYSQTNSLKNHSFAKC